MAGRVALDDVETGADKPVEMPDKEPPINTEKAHVDTETPESEPAKEVADEDKGLGGDTPEKQKPEQPATEKFMVGDKEYTRDEAIKVLEKVSRFQGDRDRAEALVSKLVTQLREQGLDLDDNFKVIKPTVEPTVTKEELAERATAGDKEALIQLLDMTAQETAGKVYGNLGTVEQGKRILDKMHKEYPECYNEDGTPNMDHPLTKEMDKVIKVMPHLANPTSLLAVAELAKHRLFNSNLKQHEQKIINETLKKHNISVANAGTQPGAGGDNGLEGILSPEQEAVAKRLGSDPGRLRKLVANARTSKSRGIFID